MTLLRLLQARLAFGEATLLGGAEMTLGERERIGLIGRNGTGKSTLLKVLDGSVDLDAGSVERRRGLRVAYVPQAPVFPEDQTAFDAVAASFADVRHAVAAISTTETMGALQDHIDAQAGWDWRAQVETAIGAFGLSPEMQIADLSGGARKRVALARAWARDMDVLLLDEPTNHLDLDSIKELETMLARFSGSAIVVTHDRAFLDHVTTRILELDRGALLSFPGNFSDYEQRKAEQIAQEELAQARADKLLAQEERWIRQGVEARRTRSRDRIKRLHALRADRAARRQSAGLARMRVDEQIAGYQGKVIAKLEDVSFAYAPGATKVVDHLTTTIERGDKVGVIGPNGAGKTTLLKLILGELEPDSGTIQRGANLRIAYDDQARAALDPEATLEDFISPGSEWIEIGGKRQHVKSYLSDFLFSAARARSPVKTLSGGERARLLLARLFALPTNVLVLDEPTNDLDIETLELLEELLQNYNGTVFLVSHDRRFMDNVVTSTIAWDGPGIWTEYDGDVEDWLAQSARTHAARQQAAVPANAAAKQPAEDKKPSRAAPRTRKLSYREQRELDAMPARIEALENEQNDIRAQLSDGALYKTDLQRAIELQARDGEIEQELMEALERWETLGG